MRKLKKVLPRYYKDDELTGQIQNAAGHMELDMSTVTNEMSLETSEYALKAEEDAIGGIGQTGKTKKQRANAVRARYLLCNGKLSVADLQSALYKTPYGGTIKVREPRGNPTILDLTFGGYGKPSGSDELMERMTQSLPCNVYINPIYVYKMHYELNRYTHNQLKAYTHDQIRGGEVE